MSHVTLRILPDPRAIARARTEDMRAALAEKPNLVLVANTGNTPVAMYESWGRERLDLSAVHLYFLDSYLLSPSRGFATLDHVGCFTRFASHALLGVLASSMRPLDWHMLGEDTATCEEVARALAEQPCAWYRPAHPVTGEPGAEVAIRRSADGVLARIRGACEAYEQRLSAQLIDIVSLGVGLLPYPHLAFNTGPYTRPEALTHLTVLDLGSRQANRKAFGGVDNVPPYALTTGPATLTRADLIWITAFGTAKAEPLAYALGDPRLPDFELRSSLGYALRARAVDIVVDEAAAVHLLQPDGVDGLSERFAQAGHSLHARWA